MHYRFFDVMVDPESRRYFSEDYGFCRLWEKIGGEIFVDANSNLFAPRRTALYRRFRRHAKIALSSAVGAPEGQRIALKSQADPVTCRLTRTRPRASKDRGLGCPLWVKSRPGGSQFAMSEKGSKADIADRCTD